MRKGRKLTKKYVSFKDPEVYAIICSQDRTVYYNIKAAKTGLSLLLLYPSHKKGANL